MENIHGILISKWQIKCFLERLAHHYQGWEIEDILSALINKDIEEFEGFVTGEFGYCKELEEEVGILKEKLKSIEDEYITTIREQEARLTALGHSNMIVADRESLLRMRDEEEKEKKEETLKEKVEKALGATE